MIIGVSFIMCSLFYIFLLSVVYFSKERVKTVETKIYSYLLILNILGLSLEMLCCYTVVNMDKIPIINEIVNRLYLSYFATFISLFTIYTYITCEKKFMLLSSDRIRFNRGEKFVIGLLYMILLSSVLFLPLKYYSATNAVYSYGPATDSLVVASVLFMIIDFICVFRNIKTINKRKLIPMFFLLILFLAAFIIRQINPGIILTTCAFAFDTAIMYFTIENPDMKIVEEYQKNREIVEQNVEEKSNVLFKVSEEVKIPVRNIKEINKNILNSNNIKEIHNESKKIDDITNQVGNIIDNVLDISTIDKHNIKLFKTTYNIYNIFNQVIAMAKQKVNKNIDFKYSISDAIPQKINGDSSKLKQIICSIINNSFKHTKSGIVDLDISAIIKYDVCRLIIKVSDTGEGMSLLEINEILAHKTNENINTDSLDIDLKSIKKIVDLLDGNLLIKTNEEGGTTITVILNQLVSSEKEDKKMDSLVKALSNKRRVLIVDDDYLELERLTTAFNQRSFEVITTMYGKDCIDKLEHKEVFDYIILDDEMKQYNAVTTIENVPEKYLKNNKFIIMLEKDKESIKDHYLKDYPFTDYLLKSNYKEEINRIINK